MSRFENIKSHILSLQISFLFPFLNQERYAANTKHSEQLNAVQQEATSLNEKVYLKIVSLSKWRRLLAFYNGTGGVHIGGV